MIHYMKILKFKNYKTTMFYNEISWFSACGINYYTELRNPVLNVNVMNHHVRDQLNEKVFNEYKVRTYY
jgi:hypothetical protein